MKRLGILRFIPLWPVALACLLLLFWNQRLEIGIWALDQFTIRGDIKEFNISPSRIDLDRSVVKSMTFLYRAGEQEYQVISSGIEIVYKISSFRSFSIESVNIQNLSIEQSSALTTDRTRKVSALKLDQILSDSRRVLGLSLPVQEFTVAELDVSLAQQKLSVQGGSLVIRAEERRLLALLQDGPRYLDAELEAGNLAISIGTHQPQKNEILNLGISTQEADRNLRVTAELDSNGFGKWLSSYPLTAAIGASLQDIDALINMLINISPRDQEYLAEISLGSDQVNSEDFKASGASASINILLSDEDLEKPMSHIDFDTMTHFEAKKLEFGDIRVSDLNLNPLGFAEIKDGVLIAELRPGSRASASTLAFDEYIINDIKVTPVIAVKDASIEIFSDFGIEAGQITGPDFSFRQTSLSADNASTMRVDPGGSLIHKGSQWIVQTELDLGQNQAVSGVFNATILNIDEVEIRARIKSDDPAISLDLPLPLVRSISAEVLLSSPVLTVEGTLEASAAGVPLKFSLNHNIESEVGQGHLLSTSPIAATLLPDITNDLELELPDTLSFADGEVDLKLDAEWKQGHISLRTGFNAVALSGNYQEYLFRDMTIAGTLEILPVTRSDGILTATIGSLEYGVVLDQITSAFSVGPSQHGDLPNLIVDNIQGGLWSSTFTAGNFTLDLNKPDSKFDLKIQNLDIEQVVAAQGIEGLEVTGQIDGSLPVTISSSGISIENGEFWNHLGGGRIEYSMTDEQVAALENPLTDVVITALRDFRYRILTIDADYHPNGDLHMNFQLKGFSPKLDTKRPVHLNINSEQNVLSLLESLSYSEGVNKALEKQIQEKFE